MALLLRRSTVVTCRSAIRPRFYSEVANSTKQRVILFPIGNKNNKQWMFYKVPEHKKGEEKPSSSSGELLLFNSLLGENRTSKFIDSRYYNWYCYFKKSALLFWDKIEKAPESSLRKTVLYPPATAIFNRSITPSEKLFAEIVLPTTFSKKQPSPVQVCFFEILSPFKIF